jgi:hypothetical protein
MHLVVSLFIIPGFIVVITLIFVGANSSLYGQVQSNFTSSVCNPDGSCTTTICINNEPCKTMKLNSTTGTGTEDNFNDDENETIPLAQLPQQII